MAVVAVSSEPVSAEFPCCREKYSFINSSFWSPEMEIEYSRA